MRRLYTLYVTGGIGSGKSLVAKMLGLKGARVVSLDEIAADVLTQTDVKRELSERFGREVLVWPCEGDSCWIAAKAARECLAADAVSAATEVEFTLESNDPGEVARERMLEQASVDKAALARLAFATPQDTLDLNAITHPRITELLTREIVESGCSCMGRTPRVLAVEYPLIDAVPEALAMADEIMTVSVPAGLRRSRAIARGMDGADFDAREARQITDEQRAGIADTVIANDGDPVALAARVEAWWNECEAAGWKPVRGVGKAAGGEAGDVRRPSCRLKSPAIAFVGRHNSGKTTLVEKVIAELTARGYDVGSVKHHGHRGFEIDVPGKDSWRHHEAGANEVAICSPDRFALMRDLDDGAIECSEIVDMMAPHDVVIVEGYRHSGVPAIEIMRSGNERDVVAAQELVRSVASGKGFEFDPTVLGGDSRKMPDGLTVALASDIPAAAEAARELGLATFDIDDCKSVADYIVANVIGATSVAGR